MSHSPVSASHRELTRQKMVDDSHMTSWASLETKSWEVGEELSWGGGGVDSGRTLISVAKKERNL